MQSEHSQTFSKLATITIQGGGVFGISLLGQLKAIEEQEFDVAVYAGSSAGALIATLAWAGLDANHILEEIFGLLRGNRLKRTLANRTVSRDGSRDSFFAKIQAKYNAVLHSQSKPGYLANLRAMKNVLQLVMLVKRSNIFEHRGMFDGDGVEAWIDALLCNKLNETRRAHELPEIKKDVLFSDFFETYEAIGGRRQALLMIGVTNLSREDFLLIDSHSSAFEKLRVAGVVRASISFPVFFRPKDLQIIRDSETGRVADSRSFERGTTYRSRETFVDGGVVSNFPAWRMLDLARETMWGGSMHTTHLRAAPRSTPLRASSFRPMVHIGLQVQKQSPLSDNEPEIGLASTNRTLDPEEFLVRTPRQLRREYWFALFDLATSAGKARLESLLIGHRRSLRNARTIFLEQNVNASGWQHHAMQLDKLTIQKAGEMFETGREFAAERLRRLRFDLARPELLSRRFQEAAVRLADQFKDVDTNGFDGLAPTGSLHLIDGPLGQEALVPVFRYPATDTPFDRADNIPIIPGSTQPHLRSRRSRSVVVLRESLEDNPEFEKITLCAPVVDRRDRGELDFSGLDLDSDDDEDNDGNEDDGDEMLEPEDGAAETPEHASGTQYVSDNRYYGVMFGIVTMEWTVPRELSSRLWRAARQSDDILTAIDEMIDDYLVSPIGDVLTSDFGRIVRAD